MSSTLIFKLPAAVLLRAPGKSCELERFRDDEEPPKLFLADVGCPPELEEDDEEEERPWEEECVCLKFPLFEPLELALFD